MDSSTPPVAFANVVEGRILTDCFAFEKFATHYSKIIHNNKNKVRKHLQHNVPRRSPRLAEKNEKIPRKTKRSKINRSVRILSESNPGGLIPVMRFSALKLKRKKELLSSIDKKKCGLPANHIDEEIIEIKDESLNDSFIENSEPTDFESHDFENVRIRTEEFDEPRSVCSSPMDIESIEEEPCLATLDADNYQEANIDQEYNYVGSNPYIYPMPNKYFIPPPPPPPSFIPPMDPYSNQLQYQYGRVPRAFNSNPTESSPLTFQEFVQMTAASHLQMPPDGSSGYPHSSPLPQFQQQNTGPLQYNCHLQINEIMPVLQNNGKHVYLGVFNLSYGLNWQTKITGTVQLNSDVDQFMFQSYFLNGYNLPQGNNANFTNHSVPTNDTMLATENETVFESQSSYDENYNIFDLENDTCNVRLNSESRIQEEQVEQPLPQEDIRNRFPVDGDVMQNIVIASSDAEEQNAVKAKKHKPNEQKENDNKHTPQTERNERINIRLRTDLINNEPTIYKIRLPRVRLPICNIKVLLIYEIYKRFGPHRGLTYNRYFLFDIFRDNKNPGFSIEHNNFRFEGRYALLFYNIVTKILDIEQYHMVKIIEITDDVDEARFWSGEYDKPPNEYGFN